jgi:hypothetical protein
MNNITLRIIQCAVALCAFSSLKAMDADPAESRKDAAIVRLAGELPFSRHVVKLEVDLQIFPVCKPLRIFSASAVAIGRGDEFITNAHCVSLWCDKMGRLKRSLFVVADDGSRQRVTSLRIHPQFLSSPSLIRTHYDIAYLRTETALVGLGIEPSYRQLADILGRSLHIVGYGTSGDFGAYFGRNDGKKRAVVSHINCFHMEDISGNSGYFASSFLGYDSGDPLTQQPVDLLPYQAGFRVGQSGGGAFLGEEYVGISSYTFNGLRKNRCLNKMRWTLYKSLKCFSALGIPVPGLQSNLGEKECVIALASHEPWIREKRAEGDIGQAEFAPTPSIGYCGKVLNALSSMLCCSRWASKKKEKNG